MKPSQIQLPEENPFAFIKVRHIVLWLILFAFAVGIWFSLAPWTISIFTQEKLTLDSDPIVEWFFIILVMLLTAAWSWRQCKLVGIDPKKIVGKIPKNFNWLAFVALIVARSLFSRSFFRISYYLTSFVAYSWIDNNLRNLLSREGFLEEISKTFSPVLYAIVYWLGNSIGFLLSIFIVYGIVLHRWSFKWGQKRAVFYFCLLVGLTSLIEGNLSLISIIIYLILEILIYLKYRSLIVIFIATIIDVVTNYIFAHSVKWYDLSSAVVEQLRDRIWVSFTLLAITTPFLIRFIYQNWHLINESLPYYKNSKQVR